MHVSTRVKVHEKNFNKLFEITMAAQNLSQTNPFFFGGRTTTGRNCTPRTKNEKDSENIYIYINEVSIVGFFRNFDFSKNGINFDRIENSFFY